MEHAFSVVAVTLFAAACAGPAEGTDPWVTDEREAIGWGRPTPETVGAPDTSAVKLEVSQMGGTEVCSATKVSANMFWTAASCIERAVAGDQVKVTNNLSGDFSVSPSYTVSVASVDVHPSRTNYLNNSPIGPRHYDVGRLIVAGDTSGLPAYSTTPHPDWTASGQSVTFTSYGTDPEKPTQSGKKQYQHFSLVDDTTLADATPHDPASAQEIYVRHMVASPTAKPYSSWGDDGAGVFQKFGTIWKIVGIVPEESGDTIFVRYGNVRNWLTSPAVNQFQAGFQGFIFNRQSGGCITPIDSAADNTLPFSCDGRLQDADRQSWRLVAWPSASGSFQVVNGAANRCLEAVAPLPPSTDWTVRHKPCVVAGVGNLGQRWAFPIVPGQASLYRWLKPGIVDLCATPTGIKTVLSTCSDLSSNRSQLWTMTR